MQSFFELISKSPFVKYKTTVRVVTSSTTNCNTSSMTKNEKQRVTIFLNPAILKHAKAQAVVEDLSLTTLIEKALIKYLPKETVIRKAEI
jgi:hypothetical protein